MNEAFSRGRSAKNRPRPFGRTNSTSEDMGSPTSAVKIIGSIQPKSPLSAVSPWGSDSNLSQETVGAWRKGSFEGGVDARPKSPIIANGDLHKEQVFVTHVESPVMFWAQTAEQETAQVIHRMSEDLQVYCRNKPLLQSTPFIDKVYGGVYPEDKQWYRCRVKNLIGDDKVQVHFVDYGNTEVISLRSIVFLSHEILSLVPFAQLYCLDGVKLSRSDLHDQAVESLNQLAAERVLTAKFKETKKALDVPCAVELRDDSEGGVGSIEEEMIRRGLLMATSPRAEAVVSADHNSRPSPPPLSPRKSSLSEVMSKEMEKLREENESLRNVLKIYKDGEKTAEEMRKYYSLQISKHQEQLNQAAGDKLMELINKVNDLHKMRGSNSLNGKAPDVINDAIDLSRKNNLDLTSLSSLQKVKEAENNLQRAQDELCNCSNKDALDDLILQRDKSRQELFNTINLFCSEVEQLPLKEREKSLKASLDQLQEQLIAAVGNSRTDGVPEEVIRIYEEWQEKRRSEAAQVRQKVDQCSDNLVNILGLLQKALKPHDSSGMANPVSFGDFDQMVTALSSAIQEELDTYKVSEDKEAKDKADRVVSVLVTQLEKEAEDIKVLNTHLVKKYKDMQTDMSQWLDAKPDVKKLSEKRKTIKSLRSRLRHRLADKKDLEEGDELETTEEVEQVEKDILDIYLVLHKSYEDEHLLLAELARSASNPFPELPLVHPELGLADFLASNGLLKPGRELEHYPYHDSVPSVGYDKCSFIKTEFAGSPCILKEYSLDRSFDDSEMLQRKAIEFSRLNNSSLVPLQAFFVKGNKGFIQMPLLLSGEQWISAHQPTSLEVAVVLRDILEGLRALHSIDYCHGCVHLQSALVEKVDGPCHYRGKLDFSPFSNPDCSKSGDMKAFGNLIAKMNFANMDPMMTFSQLTEDGDLLRILGELLDTDDSRRLPAHEALQQPYFFKCGH